MGKHMGERERGKYLQPQREHTKAFSTVCGERRRRGTGGRGAWDVMEVEVAWKPSL